ncbi:MAG: FAD-dependent oxidoreductase [Sandaracinaceae bacterium]|nr:FAD-dependent oxidoreductase [Sandaracinaceae bacterium]
MRQRVAVAGAGIFGVTGALELARRGHRVTLCDSGPLPHPLASSTDISKVVRLEYGADLFYTEAVEEALVRWRALNARWGEPLFHETGVLFLTRGPMEPGSFEAESFALLTARGHALERLDEPAIAARFPTLSSRRAHRRLLRSRGRLGRERARGGRAPRRGARRGRGARGRARHRPARARRSRHGPLHRARRARGGLRGGGGRRLHALAPRVDVRVDAGRRPAGPSLRAARARALRAAAPRALRRRHPRTGWYGFGASDAGVVKIAHHGAGVPVDPAARRDVPADAEPRFRAFLRDTLPELAEAPLAGSRLCLYCDSADGDPWIARVPDRPGLVVASGGSGHAFKLAPLLGEWIACEVEDGRGPARLGWRDPSARAEAARFVEGRAPSR